MALKRGLILSLLICLFFSGIAYSQNPRNKIERVYGNDTIISDEPLPDKVYQAHKNNILIIISFYQQEKGKEIVNLFNGSGNGSVIKPGIIITARHIFTEGLSQLELVKKENEKANIVANYSYNILGLIITEEESVLNFPLRLRAYENLRSERDLMALEVPGEIMKNVLEANIVSLDSPSNILLTNAKLADAKLEDPKSKDNDVYIVGTINNEFDLLHYVFQAKVVAILENMPANKRGLKRLYRLRGHGEPGYSGGPVLNKDGDLIGITVMSTLGYNFIYAISSKDIKDFLKDINIK